MKQLLILSTAFVLALTACNDKKAEQTKLQKQVIEKHDVLMAEMDVLMQKKAKLDSLDIQTIVAKQPDADTTAFKASKNNVIMALTNADEKMMDWMHQFNPDYTGKTTDEIISYLKNQETKIDSVKNLFDHAIAKTDSLIKKY